MVRHFNNFAYVQDFNWDEKTRAIVLSSFFWGYVVTQVPAGQLAQRCGAKVLLLWAMILCALLTMLTPICATIGGWKVSTNSPFTFSTVNFYYNT